jgi:hypothetical protein
VTDTELGTVILVWIASIPGCAIWAKLLRGRDPRSLVVSTTYQGDPATVVRGRDNFVPATVFCGCFAALFALLAVGSWSNSNGGAIVFLVPATYIGIGSWLIGSGRVG